MARLRHFVIQGTAQRQDYVSTARGSGKFKTAPPDERVAHGTRLADEVRQAATEIRQQSERAADAITFVPFVVKSGPGLRLFLNSLDNKRIGSEIINFRYEEDGSERATIHVPHDKVRKFARKFEDYAHKDIPESTTPRNRNLAESINEIRLAMLRDGDYWTDSGPPPEPGEVFWWEVWLRYEAEVLRIDGRVLSVDNVFREEARSLGIRVSDRQVRFPEYVVVLAYTSLDRLSEFPGLLRHLAEFRRANLISPREFLDLPPAGQAEFIHAMLERTTFAPDSAPAVCILDRGVNRGHPLIEQALSEKNNLAWDDDWTPADRNGHGTQMAGLALFGPNLGDLLLTDDPVTLGHRLEAVKILPDRGANNPPDYGPITVGAVAKAEVESPDRSRVICLAITADDKERGLPTLWSAAIDQMCAGAVDDTRRMMTVAAGNYASPLSAADYPAVNRNASVQDPAQAWNVLTVGACTSKDEIGDPNLADYRAIAGRGLLNPTSTTSYAWDQKDWPIKPDIVMEGGNYAASPDGRVSDVDDLSLLTTMISRDGALLTTMRDTSAATALAARYAAILAAEYPSLWPESIRGLLIHSAKWTTAMHEEFPHKEERQDLLRCYGYGVPNLTVARQCALHRATTIIQESLQPFCVAESRMEARTNEMHVHSLPWPIELLRSLGELELKMRITLSYFIEPSPGRRGWNQKHRYQSHGLRFDVRRPEESMIQFRQRLTRDAWEDHTTRPVSLVRDSRNWVLGADLRTKGSIHSDWWKGTAAELAASGDVAVHPVTGWWRERPHLGCHDKLAKYSLIVTLESARQDVAIYHAIENIIQNRTDITITT
jgi:hypothetical protein